MTEIKAETRFKSRDKKSACVRQADVPTNFQFDLTPTKNLQFYDKKSASVLKP